MLGTTTREQSMQAQPSTRHWPDILWFLFVSAILGLTCGVAVGGAALLLADAAEDAPLVCTTLVLREGEATVVCRPRSAPAVYVRREPRCCSPS